MNKKTLTLTLLLLLAASSFATAQGTYQQVDYPGAAATECMGINNAGEITGSYQDSAGVYHGFLLSGGTYSSINYPAAQETSLYRINDVGQIVGVANGSFSFVYNEADQTFTNVNFPGAGATFATSINNAGTVGGYFTANGMFSQGFELIGPTYRAFTPLKTANTYIWGITGSGELIGYTGAHEIYDFSVENGGYQEIAIPNDSQIFGANQNGSVFVGEGFLYKNNVLQKLSFPGGGITYAYGVNNFDKIVGLFLDSNDNMHCFIWTP
jgi:hypothetical protein